MLFSFSSNEAKSAANILAYHHVCHFSVPNGLKAGKCITFISRVSKTYWLQPIPHIYISKKTIHIKVKAHHCGMYLLPLSTLLSFYLPFSSSKANSGKLRQILSLPGHWLLHLPYKFLHRRRVLSSSAARPIFLFH